MSPVLLAGFAARPLPPALLQPVLALAMSVLRRRHADVFARLDGFGDAAVLIDPVDLPFVFVLRPDPRRPTLKAYAEGDAVTASAAIRGSLLALVDLLEGRIDGDALFFSRRLAIEGDTELVVALRNAVDGAEIDVAAEVLSLFGPLAGPARLVMGAAERFFARATRDLETLRAAIVAPEQGRTRPRSGAPAGGGGAARLGPSPP